MYADRGYAISWYDLGEEGKQEYLDWVHRVYVPKVLKSPGLLWAAHYQTRVDTNMSHVHRRAKGDAEFGSDYVLIFAAQDIRAFAKGLDAFVGQDAKRCEAAAGALDRDLTSEDQRALRSRLGESRGMFTEEYRVYGPAGEAQGRPLEPGDVTQLGSFDIPASSDEELLTWYSCFRLPALQKCADFVGARKLLARTGPVRDSIFYQFTSLQGRERAQRQVEENYPEEIAWTKRAIPALNHAPRSPVLAEKIFFAKAG